MLGLSLGPASAAAGPGSAAVSGRAVIWTAAQTAELKARPSGVPAARPRHRATRHPQGVGGQPSDRPDLALTSRRSRTGHLCCRWSFQRHPPVVIVQADDVVLAEVVTVLDFNEHERGATRVVNPVSRASRDIDGISSPYVDAVAVECDNALSANHEPMLGAVRMLLVAQPLPRLDLNRLDFEILGLGEDGVSAPRAVGMLDHPAILPDVQQDG
jgi:hypothetical protein